MLVALHLTTVHPRGDVRIAMKEVATLGQAFDGAVALLVADGLGDGATAAGLRIHDIGKPPGGRVGRALVGSWRALAKVRQLKPIIAHLHDPELLPLGFVLKALGYKVVYDVHEDLHLQIMGKGWVPAWLRRPLGFMWKQLERAGLALFDGIAPATPHIATRFPGPKTALVQNFPIVGEFKGASLGSYGARQPVFAYLGGLTAERGAVEMVRAMGALPQSITAGLEIAGTLAPATLVHSVEHLDGWRRVRLLGQIGRDDASALLGRARAGLVLFHPLPNHLDAYPTKLFEYMSAGLPVIASDFPAWREIVARHQCGRLCDPLDTDAIADAMRWILDNPEEADYMGKRGRAAIDAHYSWDNEAARLVACYRRILAA